MAEDESVAEDQTGALGNWDRLNAWKNDWVATPGVPDIMLQPSDFLSSTTATLNDISDVDVSGATDGDIPTFDSGTSTWTAQPNGSALVLNSGLLAVKTWDTGTSAYVWPGGTAPDASSYDFIRFRGPDDPLSATGGRDVTGDEWLNTAP